MRHRIAFLGDVVLDKLTEDKFADVERYFKDNKIQTCLNLESPFVDKKMKEAIKDKVCLRAEVDSVGVLHQLNPFLINLSNNHINDYGNNSCELTFETLEKNSLTHFGVGLKEPRNNMFVDNENKLLYLAYTTKSADLTGSKLFAEENFIGVYDVDFDQISTLKKKYPDYFLVANMHWGIEDIKIPEPSKRELAKQVIDSGADLIIGHHPHIIQPYEIYKGKYIYYSIGNFYFPEIEYFLEGKKYVKKMLPHQKEGIVPIFVKNVNDFYLEDILYVKNKRSFLYRKGYKHVRLNNDNARLYMLRYKVLYYLKMLKHYSRSFIEYIFTDPKRILRAIKKRI